MSGKYSEKFKQLYSVNEKIANFCGANILNQDYKITWRVTAIFLLIYFSIGFIFYTNYMEIVSKNNWYIILKSTSVIGTAIQGYVKLTTVMNHKENIRFLHREVTDMYEIFELKSLVYKTCLKNNIAMMKNVLNYFLIYVCVTMAIVVGIPIYMLIFLNKRIELLPFKVPYIDINTNFGFYSTFGTHVICVFFAGFGNFFMDSLIIIYVGHVPLMKNILKCMFDDLDRVLETNSKDVEKSRDPLNDIFRWHQKYLKFCDTLKDTFFWVIFVQVSTEFVGIVSTIVCIFLGIWPPAPAYLLYLFLMFYSYCSLGNIVEVANDDVIIMIYDFCWYNLTVSEQKMILIMLRESQQATGISVGGVAPLSLNTALQVTKTVYTMSMMLKEFLN